VLIRQVYCCPNLFEQITADEAASVSQDWPDTYRTNLTSEEEAHQELRGAALSYEALLTSSMALDKQVKDSRRIAAAIEAERLLSEDTTLNYVLNAYCSHPMPTSADLEGAERICETNELGRLQNVIKTVKLFQENIRATREAWEKLDLEIFGGSGERTIFQAEAVRAGLFQSLMKRIADEKKYKGFLNLLNNPNIARLPRSKRVLMEWLLKARSYSATPIDFVPAFYSAPTLQVPSHGRLMGQATIIHTGVKRAIEPFGGE